MIERIRFVLCALLIGVPIGVPIAACKPKPSSSPPATVDRATLSRMAVITLGEQIDDVELDKVAADVARDPASLDGYIQRLVRDPRMGGVAASITFKQTYSTDSYTPWKGNTLKLLPGSTAEAPIYWLHEQCKDAEAVEVQPWWAMDQKVRVCPEAYRPDVDEVKIPEAPASAEASVAKCSSLYSAAQGLCGCGKNLFRCARNMEMRETMRKSTYAEIRDTVADNIARDRPIAELFTANDTVRDRWTDALYRRWTLDAGFPADFSSWKDVPEVPTRMPRPELAPGQHAGLLTGPKLLTYNANHRGKLMQYFEILWCSKHVSKGVEPELVLGLVGSTKERTHAANLEISNEGWQQISKMPACTGCHARMDYGVQFWLGWDNFILGGKNFQPKLVKAGTGPIYNNNLEDHRSDGELTPATFAKLVTQEPEFRACMVENVASAVLGDTTSDADVTALKLAFDESPTFSKLMSVTLKLYASRDAAPSASGRPAVAHTRAAQGKKALSPKLTSAGETIDLGRDITTFFENECTSCHEEGLYDEKALAMPRARATRALEQIAFETMPKDRLLDTHERERIVLLLIDRLWHDPAQRDEARRYFSDRLRPHTVVPIGTATRMIHGKDEPVVARAAERGIYSEHSVYSPGFVGITAVEAIAACKRGDRTGDALAACIREATAPARYFR